MTFQAHTQGVYSKNGRILNLCLLILTRRGLSIGCLKPTGSGFATTQLVENPVVGGQQMRRRGAPGQGFHDPFPAQLSKPFRQFGVFNQPNQLAGKIARVVGFRVKSSIADAG